MFLINSALFVISTFFTVLVGFLALQIFFALFRSEKPKSSLKREKRESNVAILVPAHNEEAVIERTIKGIVGQLLKNDRLIVVADNCTDKTAEIAKLAGAEVIVRKEDERRGKGYALDFGIKHLQKTPPDAVIIIDADCDIDDNAVNQLTIKTLKHECPVQALYLIENVQGATLKQKVAEFAFLVKNLVRPLGMMAMGSPCQLMGTGMAFPWQVINSINLANGNIVEDMKMGVDLILAGKPTLFYPEVIVVSLFPTENVAVNNQRKRWEHGHMEMIFNQVPLLLFQGVRKLNFKLIMFSLDLAVLPLALLSILLFLFTLIAFGLSMFEGVAQYEVVFLVIISIFTLSILSAWHQYGKKILTPKDLMAIPFYIIAKIPLYLEFFTNKQSEWVKTERDENNKNGTNSNDALKNEGEGL